MKSAGVWADRRRTLVCYRPQILGGERTVTSMRSSWVLVAALVTLGAGLPAAPAFAELAKWDQARVTELAEELTKAAGDLYTAIYQQMSGQAGGQGRSFAVLKDRVRLARSESRHLASELKAGKGHDATFPVYERLMELVRDARENARRVYLEEPTLDKIAATEDVLRRLAPYYDPKALSDGGDDPAGSKTR